MDIAAHIKSVPNAVLTEEEQQWKLSIRKGENVFLLTVPKDVNELFYDLYHADEKIFSDWTDYYDKPEPELREELQEDVLHIIDILSKSSEFRVRKEGSILKQQILDCKTDGVWQEFEGLVWKKN